MSQLPNNPGTRLLQIIERAQSSSQLGPQPAKVGWAHVFGIEQDADEVLLHVADLIRLALDAKSAVVQLDGIDQRLYVQPVDNILRILANLNLEQQWGSLIGSFDPTTMNGLRFVSDTLSRNSKSKSVDEDALLEFQKQAQELQDAIVASELPPDLKDVITELLTRVQIALRKFQIFGPEKVSEAVQAAYGAIFIHKEGFIPHRDSPVLARMWTLLGQIADTFTVIQAVHLLGQGIQRLIGPG